MATAQITRSTVPLSIQRAEDGDEPVTPHVEIFTIRFAKDLDTHDPDEESQTLELGMAPVRYGGEPCLSLVLGIAGQRYCANLQIDDVQDILDAFNAAIIVAADEAASDAAAPAREGGGVASPRHDIPTKKGK